MSGEWDDCESQAIFETQQNTLGNSLFSPKFLNDNVSMKDSTLEKSGRTGTHGSTLEKSGGSGSGKVTSFLGSINYEEQEDSQSDVVAVIF